MQFRHGLLKKALTAFTLSIAAGCTQYNIRVNGYTANDLRQDFGQSSSFCLEEKDTDNPLLEKEIRRKAKRLLEAKGYTVGEQNDADYLLKFRYGITDSGGSSTTTILIDSGQAVSTSYPTHERRLTLTLYRLPSNRAIPSTDPVWVGEIWSIGSNSDLREVLDYLLVAGFEYFGMDTKKARNVTIYEGDKRVRSLLQ